MNEVVNDKLYAVIDINGDDAFKIICFFKLSPAVDTVKLINTQNFPPDFFGWGGGGVEGGRGGGSVLLVEDIFQME